MKPTPGKSRRCAWSARMGSLRRRILRAAWMVRVETGIDGGVAARWTGPAPGVTVRRATAADAQAVAGVALGREPLVERMVRGEIVFVAEADGRAVGSTFLSRTPVKLDWYLVKYTPRPDEAYHYGLHVVPESRKRGVGVALSRAVIEAAGVLGARQVVCFIDANNQAGLSVQRQLGGRECSIWLVLVALDRWSIVLWRRPWRRPAP